MNTQTIINAVVSHALATGFFSRCNAHEPKSKNVAVGGMTCAVWCQRLGPVPRASGLATTSGRLELTVRVYTNMLAEPQDAIDPAVMEAVDALLTAYSGDFELGGNIRNIDLLGAAGEPLQARAGYVSQSGTMYRIVDITLPLILNDLWNQAA